VAQFDARLLNRLQMPPGITGFWQVEARANPHFGAYRRLELFYVDNWSLNLDWVILVATVEQMSKAVRSLFGSSDDASYVTALESVELAPDADRDVRIPWTA
jgi:lipopolysaccharide/colanic/teichoic acid biosynthesis glycosyltransferase